MPNYNIIGTGSLGNSVIYFDEIMVDAGLPFNKLEEFLRNVKVILLTHKHHDHFLESTISRIGREYPNIVLIFPRDLIPEVKALDYKGLTFVIDTGRKYNVGHYVIEAFKLFHDVPNIGYKIYKDDYKIIHATDTGSIDHIEAKDFDLYAIEHSYDNEIIEEAIRNKINDGVYAYEVRSKEYHLSFQQAEEWILSQKKDTSEVVLLHVSSSYLSN